MLKNIKILIIIFFDTVVDENIKKTITNTFNLRIKYKILWIILLPFSFIFIFINFVVVIISLLNYSVLFLNKLIKIRFFKKKPKNLIYKQRFKFFKNFYIILFEKILITYPKQKAFLIFYTISKSLYEKNMSILKKEYLPEFLRSLSNRILVLIVFSIPYILIYCNTNLIKIIEELEEFNYDSKLTFFNTILVNILKDLTNDYNKLILKLKIKFYKNKIIFNSKKDLLNALKYKKEFQKNFNTIKFSFKYGMVKHEIFENKYNKSHLTAMTKIENEKILYLNETSSENLIFYKYNEKFEEFVKKLHTNMYIHKGAINDKKNTFYTPNIITEKKKILVVNNYNNNIFIKNIKEENLNNIISSFSLNLDEKCLENTTIKMKGIHKNILIEKINSKKTIELFKENKNFFKKDYYESILGIQFFWKENEKIIKNLSFFEKLNLCRDLNIEIDSSSKEINFQIFKSIINKK